MKSALVILAAGLGSRYGGSKQIDPVGPNGEIIIDYSIYDAIFAGFKKIVLIIRKDLYPQMESRYKSLQEKGIEVVFVFQDVDNLPEGFTALPSRTKPWGTVHALWSAKEAIANTPFAIINADDFYGRDAYIQMHKYLENIEQDCCAMIGYSLHQTLSNHGSVSRGICKFDNQNTLLEIIEHKNISIANDNISSSIDNQEYHLKRNEITSMNFWGFHPNIISYLSLQLEAFLSQYYTEESSEFVIPTAMNELVKKEFVHCKIIPTKAKWFGITYLEDKTGTIEKIKELHETQEYPSSLFNGQLKSNKTQNIQL